MASKYMFKFVTEPDDSLKCVICLEVAKDPKQHEECGKLFCSDCIEKNGNSPCPICRAETLQYFKDKKSLREIEALRVRCDNIERGCDWEGTVGTFGDHVSKCVFTLFSCPNKCEAEGKVLQLMRSDLDDHLKTTCPNRDYECELCGEKGTYASITRVHDGVCIKKTVSCPNIECTVTMERGLTKEHVESVCEYTIVACRYASIGCSMKKIRMEMKQHKEDDKSHLPLSLEKIVKLENDISSLKDTTSSQKDTIFSLEAIISSLEVTTSILENTTNFQEVTISSLKDTTSSLTKSRQYSNTFNLRRFSKKKKLKKRFCSEPFYTNPGGYRMIIIVLPNGYDTHVSVYAQILEGPYDDKLPWPFLGTMTVELLNQSADDKHYSRMMRFNARDNKVGLFVNYLTFISHSDLCQVPRNIQYLMRDALYFRVTVDIDNQKPWLDCTHHI